MPTGAIVLLVFLLAFAVVVSSLVVVSDRKRRRNRPSPGFDWMNESILGTTRFDVNGDLAGGMPEAMSIAQRSINAVGGIDTKIFDSVVEGWSRTPTLGLGWAPQQIVVKVIRADNGSASFTCCCRPRFGSSLGDAGQGRRLAARLASELQTLLHSPAN